MNHPRKNAQRAGASPESHFGCIASHVGVQVTCRWPRRGRVAVSSAVARCLSTWFLISLRATGNLVAVWTARPISAFELAVSIASIGFGNFFGTGELTRLDAQRIGERADGAG